MPKSLESIIDYHKYVPGAKFLTSLGIGDILLASSFNPVISLSLGFGILNSSLIKNIDLIDDLALINEMRKIYDEILKHYNELNKVFDFNDPVEMFALYIYVLEKGYLSLHHRFKYHEVHKEIHGFLGIETILGKGVCRHTSATLVDIFKNNGVISKECGVVLGDEEELCYSTNHSIVEVEKDGIIYLLDPTNALTFKPSTSRSIYVCGEDYIYLNPLERLKIRKDLDFTSKKDDKKIIKKTLKTCFKNKDILQSFYKENKDLYEDAAQKKLSIQRYFGESID